MILALHYQGYERVVLSALLWNFYGQVLRLKWDLSAGS